jgi:predicted nucleic acid-binding protein
MSYNIKDLSSEKVRDSTKYFFDANVWIYLLYPTVHTSKTDEAYISFFETVSKHNNNTKIVVTSFLLSEIINRYLRDIGMRKFANAKGDTIDSSYFKMKYRANAQYAIDYESVCDDNKAYHKSIEFVSDDFGSFKPKDILKSPNVNLDFNDTLAVKLAQKNGFVVVTHDKDFWVEGILVITKNRELLQKMAKQTSA